jgi:hypothetical protein
VILTYTYRAVMRSTLSSNTVDEKPGEHSRGVMGAWTKCQRTLQFIQPFKSHFQEQRMVLSVGGCVAPTSPIDNERHLPERKTQAKMG